MYSDLSIDAKLHSEIEFLLQLVSGLASFLLQKFFLIFFSALCTVNIQAASSLVRSTGSEISDMLNNFDEFHQEACDWASQVDINASLPSVRIRRRKLQPGETATEQLMTGLLLRFKAEFFYPIVGVCVTQWELSRLCHVTKNNHLIIFTTVYYGLLGEHLCMGALLVCFMNCPSNSN